jgi:nitrogen fixation-related uncharacterized protein
MRRPLVLLICSLLLALAGASPGHGVETGGYGIRLLDAPTDRQDDPRARQYVVDHVQQGDSFRRRFEVRNGTTAPVTLQLYATAADISQGSFAISGGRTANELASWVTVSPSSVDLAPGETAVATLSVAVPDDAEDGERYGAVVAEAPAVTTGGNVGVGSRVGIRMYLNVGDGAEPASDFVVESLQAARAEDGTPVVTAQVRNTGGRALDLSGSLALSEGPGGLSAGPFPAELGTTLGVGQTSGVLVRLPEAITGGPWRAVLTLKSSRLEKAAEASLTFPDEAGTANDPVAAEEVPLAQDLNVLIPIAIGLILLIALLLLLLLWRRRRKNKDDEDEPADAEAVAVS